MPGVPSDRVHGYVQFGEARIAYKITVKHHSRRPDVASWLFERQFDDEFRVFDVAVTNAVCCAKGHFYGVLRAAGGELLTIGTCDQQVAKFWRPENDESHGFPVCPVNGEAHPSLQSDRHRPRREVFDKMVDAGLVSPAQAKKLKKGNRA